jgi:hypothetical protein
MPPNPPSASGRRHSSTWPLLCILICLFVLSATSPSIWEWAAKKRGSGHVAAPAADAPCLPAEVAGPARATAPIATPGPTPQPAPACPVIPLAEKAAVAAAKPLKADPPSENAPRVPDQPPPAELGPAPGDLEPAEVSLRIATPVSIPAREPGEDLGDRQPPSLPRDAAEAPKAELESTPEPVQQRPAEAAEPSPPIDNVPPQDPPVAEQPKVQSLWPEPQALLEQLDELAGADGTGAWAREVKQSLQRLGAAMNENQGETAAAILAGLAELRKDGDALADRLAENAASGKLRRAGYALERRLVVWKQTVLAGGLRAPAGGAVRGDAGQLSACLAAVDALTRGKPQGQAWSQYLTLESLRELAGGRTVTEDQARAVAKAVLQRLGRVPMNPRQRQFIAEKPIAALRAELRRWASRPVEFREVLEHLEQYEKAATAGDARLLGEDGRRLALSASAEQRQLGQWLESNYRNANVRVAVAGQLLNRLIPERPDQCQDVDDVVAGRTIHGESVTSTEVAVRLVPDPQRVRMTLEIQGEVTALTHSESGPATFYNDSQSSYRAWKEIQIGPRGMVLRPAQVAVSNELQLRSVSTDFDPIPLVGPLAQEIARSQHESKRCQMSAEVEEKIQARAKEQIDGEAGARLGSLAKRLQSGLLEPLAALSLGPALLSAETTGDRAAMRLRLASDEQLGSHTPRPRAPSDSLGSVQIHQSAINNLVEQLQLDGGTFTLPELRQRIAQRLNRPELLQRETEDDDVKIAMAPKDAVQVQCRDGHVALILSVASLEKEPRAWEDFQVRVFYRPQVSGRSVELVREDVIQLIGEDLSTRSQIALRGIFAKTFPRHRSVQLVPERILKDRRLAGIQVTQLAIDDGWFALALGPARPAAQAARGEGRGTRDEAPR